MLRESAPPWHGHGRRSEPGCVPVPIALQRADPWPEKPRWLPPPSLPSSLGAGQDPALRSHTGLLSFIWGFFFFLFLQEEGFDVCYPAVLIQTGRLAPGADKEVDSLKGKGEGGRLAGAAMHYLLLLSHVWSQPGLRRGIMDCKAPLYAPCGRRYILGLSHSSKPGAMLCAG